MDTEKKQDYEELAEDDQLRYKQQMQEYQDNFINKYKKTDEISRQFVEKLKCLQAMDEQ